jgi:hypothetical protein
VKQIVANKLEVYGIVKPGARMEEMVNTVNKGSVKLTNKDIVVIWGGIHDVAKNETDKGLQQIKTCVEDLKQTNIIVMSVPHRYDLGYKSIVNEEIKRFNRTLRKIMKRWGNVRVIEVESKKGLFYKSWVTYEFKRKGTDSNKNRNRNCGGSQ